MCGYRGLVITNCKSLCTVELRTFNFSIFVDFTPASKTPSYMYNSNLVATKTQIHEMYTDEKIFYPLKISCYIIYSTTFLVKVN